MAKVTRAEKTSEVLQTSEVSINASGFKETEVGYIPADWEVTTIGDLIKRKIITVKNGFACGEHNQDGNGVPHLRPFNVDSNGLVSLDTIKYIESDPAKSDYLLRPGDVLFNNTNSEELVGKTAYWSSKSGDYVLSNHMTIIRVLHQAELDSFFLARLLHKYWYDGYYRGICRRHVNQASISLARISAILVPIPPLPEQRAIAHVLSTIQRAIAAQDAVIAAAREVKWSLMHRLFTYGPYAEPVPTQEAEIGEIPEKWELVRIGDVFDVQLGKMLSQKARSGKSPHPYMRNANVQWGWIDLSDVSTMDFSSQEAEKFSLVDGDLLVCEGGEVGRTAIWRNQIEGCYYQKALHRLRPKDGRIIPEFFMYWFMTAFLIRNIYGVAGTQTTIAHLPAVKLKALQVPITSLGEQRQIASMIEGADAKITAEENRKTALQALFKSMLHQLMTGKVRAAQHGL